MGNAIACLKVSIHAPGFGNRLIHLGKRESRMYGLAKPSAMLVKIINAECQGIARAAPTATPKNGAMHGVATIVAKKPEKNDPK